MQRGTTFGLRNPIAALLTGALSFAGCTNDNIAVKAPAHDGAKSLLVVVEEQDESRVWARALQHGRVEPFTVDMERSARVTLLFYTETLDDLALPPGEQEIDPARSSPCLIPASPSIYRAELVEGDLSAWQVMTELSESVRALRIRPPDRSDPCQDLSLTRYELISISDRIPGEPTVIAGTGTPQAIVGDRLGVIRLVHLEDRNIVVQTSTSTEHVFHQAFSRDGNEHWLAGPGVVARFAPDDGTFETHAIDVAEVTDIDGSSSDEELEIFVVGDEGQFLRYDGQRWTSVWDGFGAPATQLRSVARTGPAEAIAAGSGNIVYRYRSGAITSEAVPWDGHIAATAALHHAALGTVIAFTDHNPSNVDFSTRLFWNPTSCPTQTPWAAHGTESGTLITDFAAVQNRIFLTGSQLALLSFYGIFGEASRDGICIPARETRDALPTQIVPIHDHFLILVGSDFGPPFVTLLSPRPL